MKFPTPGFVIAMFLAAGWPLAGAAEPAGDTLRVSVGETVEITHSHRYCWFPTVHQFASGEIMVTTRMSPDECNPEGDFSSVLISRDGARTWSHRYTMGAGANVDGAYSAVPAPDGTIWNLYGWVHLPHRTPQGDEYPATLTKYSRGGMEFTQVRDAVFRLSQPVGRSNTQLYSKDYRDAFLLAVPEINPFGPIIPSLDGGWLAPIEFWVPGEKWRSLGIIRSGDSGRTWVQISTISNGTEGGKRLPWVGEEGPDESSLVRLADNRLYSIFRTGKGGYMGQAWSADDGRTWTDPTSTGFRGVAPKLRRLANGALACTYGRPGPVSIMISPDGTGKTWTHLTPIFSGMSTRYTDFIEIRPGHLFVVYDSVPYGWDPIPEADATSLNRVLGSFVDVSR